jgi:hypothetical protein
MKSLHMGVTTPHAITRPDFDALVTDLVSALDGAGVTAADKAAILGALGPQCDVIVANGTGCDGRKVTALTGTNTLVAFDSKKPTMLSAPVAITGLQNTEKVVGISIRPKDGTLYGLASPTGRVYTIDPKTGAVTAVGNSPVSATLTGTNFGFDFNPVADRIRAVSDTGQNLRLSPDQGTVAGTDPAINPAGASVTAVAYTNSSVSAPKVTTLYDIDVTNHKLVRQGGIDGNPSPNTGTLTAVGDLGVAATGAAGFDIVFLGGANYAYAVLNVGGTTSLYTVSLTTGAATAVGLVGNGNTAIKAIAVQP